MARRSLLCAWLLLPVWAYLGLAEGEDLFPKAGKGHQIVQHKAYSLGYDEKHEQAAWVYYVLNAEKIRGNVKRTNDFRADPAIITGSASLADYKGSGYDRGHLCPAADCKWSKKAMSESFLMSNMSPQLPGFNRGIWKKVESFVRLWGTQNEEVEVVTGPVLVEGLVAIGGNSVSVPRHYYKIVMDRKEPGTGAIGFVLPHEPSKKALMDFAVTVDSVESLTGIDFFPGLPDSLERVLEGRIKAWIWDFIPSGQPGSVGMGPTQGYSRCKGITKSGKRCKRKTKNEIGYCWQHEGK